MGWIVRASNTDEMLMMAALLIYSLKQREEYLRAQHNFRFFTKIACPRPVRGVKAGSAGAAAAMGLRY